MKVSQINFVGEVIRQLKTVPQHQLTQEYVATLFADRLEKRYSANFHRTKFLQATGVSPRMIESVEERVPASPGIGTTQSGHPRPFAPKGCS